MAKSGFIGSGTVEQLRKGILACCSRGTKGSGTICGMILKILLIPILSERGEANTPGLGASRGSTPPHRNKRRRLCLRGTPITPLGPHGGYGGDAGGEKEKEIYFQVCPLFKVAAGGKEIHFNGRCTGHLYVVGIVILDDPFS